MIGVMSLTTRPASFRPTREYLLLHSTALAYAKQHFERVELVTDHDGLILADRMRWPYDSFTLDLEHADPRLSEIWSSGKLYAQLAQTKPFCHVDNDILLFQRLPDEALTARVFAQSKDEPFFYLADWAQEAMKKLGISPGVVAFNTGLIGGTDVDALHAYAREALACMVTLAGQYDPHGLAILVEQAVFGAFFRNHGIRVSEIIPLPLSCVPNDFAGREFTHLWGKTKSDPKVLLKVAKRFEADHPEHHEAFCTNMERLPAALNRITLGIRMTQPPPDAACYSGSGYYSTSASGSASGSNPLGIAPIGEHVIAPPPKRPSLDVPAASGKTACVVTCHNYARFLPKCIDSLLAQTLPFDSIVIVDDSSTDETPLIAATYAHEHPDRIKYLRVEVRDFTDARNAGLAASIRDYRFVLFVDADNWLECDFHEQTRLAMADPDVAVAYGCIRSVNDAGEFLKDWWEDYDYDKLRHHNFADACSLVRREALEQAGGMRHTLHHLGLTDWALWLRITRNGWRMKRTLTNLYYRRHGENMNTARLKAGKAAMGMVDLVQTAMTVTIITLFSGRHFALDPFFEALDRLDWPKDGLRLVCIDNSRDESFHEALREKVGKARIQHTIIIDDSAINEQSPAEFADDAKARSRNAYALSEHLARLYARARAAMPADTDLVLCLEDDIGLPASGLSALAEGLYTHPRAGVVAGVVANRFAECLIAWVCRRDKAGEIVEHTHLTAPPSPGIYQKIDGSGFMATLFRASLFRKLALRPSPGWDKIKRPYYDFAAAQEVRRLGWHWLLSGAARCKHWRSDGGCDEYPLR